MQTRLGFRGSGERGEGKTKRERGGGRELTGTRHTPPAGMVGYYHLETEEGSMNGPWNAVVNDVSSKPMMTRTDQIRWSRGRRRASSGTCIGRSSRRELGRNTPYGVSSSSSSLLLCRTGFNLV